MLAGVTCSSGCSLVVESLRYGLHTGIFWGLKLKLVDVDWASMISPVSVFRSGPDSGLYV